MSRTILIGLDGATFSLLDGFMADGVMPFLKEFVACGTRGELLSSVNPLTPPAWTSLMTGRTPGNHGIFDFVQVLYADDRPSYRMATSRDVRCETIWSIASRQDRSVICLNYPMMFPARPINGYLIPGLLHPRHLRHHVYPRRFYDRLTTLPGFKPTELLLDLDLERESIQVLPKDRYEDWILLHTRREHQWASILRHLMVNEPCDLTAVLFDGVDKLQHLCWRFLDPELFPVLASEWEHKIRELCLEYYRQLDGYIAEIVALAGPEARVFIASDHGFGPTNEIFYVNVLLHQLGHLHWANTALPDKEGKHMTEGSQNPIKLFDWERTSAYGITSGCNGIRIRVARDGSGPGIPAEKYESFRRSLIESLLTFIDPATGERVVTRALTREEAYPGGQMQLAPDITLQLRDGGFISILNSEAVVRRRTDIAGTHRPQGVFLGKGPGVRQGATLAPFSIQDIAPLLLYSLGLPIPADFEGRLPREVFEPSILNRNPPRAGEHTRPPETFFADGEQSAPDRAESQLLEKLRALGYLE